MIAAPMNDHACLGPTTDLIVAEIADRNPAIVDLAAQFTNTDDLAAWFRTLPQRDDDGNPADGPKVAACRPPQRMNFENPSPNCFERSARFIGAAEMIDPDRVYQLATVTTPNGLHTFPTRDGAPVILDPKGTRNTPRVAMFAVDDETRRLRLQRLIGLDETKGLRGDLARAQRARQLGHSTWVDGRPIDQAIASYGEGARAASRRSSTTISTRDDPRNTGSAAGAGRAHADAGGRLDRRAGEVRAPRRCPEVSRSRGPRTPRDARCARAATDLHRRRARRRAGARARRARSPRVRPARGSRSFTPRRARSTRSTTSPPSGPPRRGTTLGRCSRSTRSPSNKDLQKLSRRGLVASAGGSLGGAGRRSAQGQARQPRA